MIVPYRIPSVSEILSELAEEATTFKNALFLGDPKIINTDNDLHLWAVIECAQKLKFHCDADIRRRFQVIGVDSSVSKFFIPLHSLLNEFSRLEKNGIAIPFKSFAIQYISLHLEIKIANAIILQFRLSQKLKGKDVSPVGREIQLLLSRKSRVEREGKLFPPRTEGGIELLYEIRNLEKSIGKDIAAKFFSKLSDARTDYYLINSLVSTLLFSLSDLNSDRILAVIYDLLLLICPDWEAPRTEDEWEEKTVVKIGSTQAKAQRVRDFALKEKGRINIRTEMPLG